MAVALLDPPSSIPDRFWRGLAEYAQAGGGVAIFLGHNALLTFNSASSQEVLPGPLKRRSKDETFLFSAAVLPSDVRATPPLWPVRRDSLVLVSCL